MKTSLFFITGIFMVTSAFAYSVKKGDSLSGIAEEHLGDWGKWKTIWNANKELISNPDLIYPGQKLSMDNSIPGNERLLVASSEKTFIPSKRKGRSQEWRLLPEQTWEKFVFRKNPEIDPDGFDRRSKVAKKVSDKTNPTVTVSSDRIAIEGEIINARTEYGQIFLGEQVFIRPEEQLQVGVTYSISSGPQKIISKRNNRVGFAYDLAGKVKIIGVRDGLFIGTIISAQKPIYRNNLLIPEVKPLYFPKAIPSVDVLVASILTTDFLNSSLLGEQQLVILDVGTNEGVKTGMIFRNYLKNDPNNGENITTRDYLIESEIQVLDVKDKFSTGIILQSRSILHSDDLVLSLMDLKDFQKNAGMQTFIQDYDYSVPLDNLDQLDDSQGLGSKEDQELRQLEKVDPKSYEGAPELGDEPAPNDLVDKTINTKAPESKEEVIPAEVETPEKVETPATAPTPEESSLAPPKEEPAKKDTALDVELDLAPPTDAPAEKTAPTPSATPAPVAPKAAPSENDLPADLAIPPDVPVEAPKS
jgi:hypothetical protein